jgi:F1F0 ATPase subunit 2
MSEALKLLLALAGGGMLGAMFFGGLWWTVRKGIVSARPALWFLGSMVARTGIALAGFYFLAGHDLKRLLLCLCGFVMARVAVTWLARRPGSGGARCSLLPIR